MITKRSLKYFFLADAILLVILIGLLTFNALSPGKAPAPMVAATVQACAPEGISVSYPSGPKNEPNTGNATQIIAFKNITTARCQMNGYPDVYLVGDNAVRAVKPSRHATSGSGSSVTIEPNEAATVTVTFRGGLATKSIRNFPECIAQPSSLNIYINSTSAALTLSAPNIPSLNCTEAVTGYVRTY